MYIGFNTGGLVVYEFVGKLSKVGEVKVKERERGLGGKDGMAGGGGGGGGSNQQKPITMINITKDNLVIVRNNTMDIHTPIP